jgi:predicted RNA binding protein YcfA (HicA-like mRNA interferase family)
MPSLTTGDLINIVQADGWSEIGMCGGHKQFTHPSKQGRVTIGFHSNNGSVPLGTTQSIMSQAGLESEYKAMKSGKINGKGGPVRALVKKLEMSGAPA